MEDLEKGLRGLLPMRRKIETVANLLDSRGLDQFVQSSEELLGSLAKLRPTLKLESLPKDFEKSLFWPRNQILHLGTTDVKELDAFWCYRVSEFGLDLFGELDRVASS